MLERPPTLAPRAAVATSHPLASSAAIEMLRLGGTAADGAVAAGAVLCVVEPWASHIGGDAFALVWDGETARSRAIQGSGMVPLACGTVGIARAGGIPQRGAVPITVPGMVAAWFHLLDTRGRLSPEQVFGAAIGLAEDGFPAAAGWQRVARIYHDLIAEDPGLVALFSHEGRGIREGDPIRQPDLSTTLRKLARDGASTFYGGDLGTWITRQLAARGGSLGLEDLCSHETEELDPIRVELNDCVLLEQPPVSQGVMVPVMMRALEEADRRGWFIDGTSPRAIGREHHLQIEVYRRVRAYRDRFFGDPRFWTSEQEERFTHWLSRKHAEGTIDRIDRDRLTPLPTSAPKPEVGDTTYLCVADSDGNVVSWIQSVFHPLGAGFIVPGTGIIMNNRMTGFSSDPESPNRLEPGKRPIHTLNSWMALRGGEPWLVGGTPGAQRQIQTNVQILRGRIARGMPLADCLHAPRWMIDDQERVAVESRGPADVRRRLRRAGHDVVRIGPWGGSGFVQALERLDGGGWLASSDPRGEGTAAGF